MDWEERVAELWSSDVGAPGFLVRAEALAAECPTPDGSGVFELAGAYDSTGRPEGAVPRYEEALRLGLTGVRRRRAAVQLASSYRNLGRPADGAALLAEELARTSDALDDAVRAFLALCLADLGREREALALALGSLAGHLPRYQRSLATYAEALTR